MNKLTLFLTLITVLNVTAQNKPCNCCTEKHTEFDFWLGNWEVTNPDVTLAGKNSISKIQDNCVLLEQWISAKGNYTGTSHNFYNFKTKQWEQIWIDNQGGNLHMKGNRIGNQMILKTDEEKDKDGDLNFHKVTWTINSDGTVRQYWETITKGKDTTVAFDGLYKKTE